HLGDQELAAQDTDRAVALPDDLQRGVERHGAPQGDLRAPLQETREGPGAVPAVAAGLGAVEAAGHGDGFGHALTIPRPAGGPPGAPATVPGFRIPTNLALDATGSGRIAWNSTKADGSGPSGTGDAASGRGDILRSSRVWKLSISLAVLITAALASAGA